MKLDISAYIYTLHDIILFHRKKLIFQSSYRVLGRRSPKSALRYSIEIQIRTGDYRADRIGQPIFGWWYGGQAHLFPNIFILH